MSPNTQKLNPTSRISTLIQGAVRFMDLDKKTVKQIRKMLKSGVDVPDICLQFNIPPENWRDFTLKYQFYK